MGSSEPLVSVVIPSFNRGYCVARAIDSALAQTHRAVELLVIDDGSTDDTAVQIATRYGDDERVRYVAQDNQGVAGARNTALALARGAYVALLDSDDTWAPWKLALQVRCMQARPEIGMIWTDMAAVDAEGRVVSPRYLRTMYHAYRYFSAGELFAERVPLSEVAPELSDEVGDAELHVGDLYGPMVMGNLVHTSTVMLSRARLERVGGFDTSLRHAGEDYEFFLRTCREGPVGFADVVSIRYQREMADRLTRPELRIHLAQNFLRTVSRAIARDRARITLSPERIDEVLAHAHGWVGEVQLDLGERSAARRHLLSSLRHRPRQVRTARLLLLTTVPAPVGSWLRRLYRAVRRTS